MVGQGPRALLIIRNDGPITFAGIADALGVDADHYTASYLRGTLSELERAGLIVAHPGADTYTVSAQWAEIQQSLELSLTRLISLGPQSIVVKPFLGPPDRFLKPADVFVAMPFADSLHPVWADHIRKAVEALDLSVARADDFFTEHLVMSDVWSAMYNARAVVADCTGRNPNVFYEIGLAHAVGRPVILITQAEEDVPFDLRSYRYIHYEFTPRGMTDFEERLSRTLRSVLDMA